MTETNELKGKKVAYAIEKACCSYNLIKWCAKRDFTIEDFDRFLAAGIEGFDSQPNERKDEEC